MDVQSNRSDDDGEAEDKCFTHTVSAIFWVTSTVFVVYLGLYGFDNPDVVQLNVDGKTYPSACYLTEQNFYARATILPDDPAFAPEGSTNVTQKFEVFFIVGFAIYLATAIVGCLGHIAACSGSNTMHDIFKSTGGFMCCCG